MLLYICCKQENNDCSRKEECKRYLNAKDNSCMTLFKYACTEENNYHLFMEQDDNKQENNIEKIEEQ